MNKSVINLVFDNFDEKGNPIPNGSHIPKLRASNPNEFGSDIKTKYCSIDDVTTDENFYYIIYYNVGLNSVIYDTFILSDKAIECCRDKNLKICFITLHEVNDDEFKILEQLNKYISDFSLNEDNFYYINNNSRLEEYKDILNTKIHTYTSIFLFELIASKLIRNKPPFKVNKEFLFSCHNKATRGHRIQTLCFLKKYDILKNTDWSYIDPELRINTFEPGNLTGYFSFVIDELEYFKKTGLKYSKYEEHKSDWLEIEKSQHITEKITEECYSNCYVNIITETFFDSPEIHISEKSFRPFYFMQLPIFVATYEHVKYLKKRFGFDMFDDLIDHSYDLEKDYQKRMKMVLTEIKRLNDNKELVIDFYKKNKNRFEENLNLFQQIYKKQETISFFKSLSTKILKNDGMSTKINNEPLDINTDSIKIYHDIIAPNKCGTRYLREYFLSNTNINTHDNYNNNSIDINKIWNFPNLNWIVIRHPEEYLKSALKTDLLYVWGNYKENELDMINRYIDAGTNHYVNNLYKILYSYSLKYKNKKFIFLKDLSDFCLFKFANKTNYKYDSTKYEPNGQIYMDKETIIEYVKETYPSQWETIQFNLKKEMFFYNKIIENCIFFNKISNPPIIVKNEETVKEVIEKNSWLKKKVI
jgi:hypothetical protein